MPIRWRSNRPDPPRRSDREYAGFCLAGYMRPVHHGKAGEPPIDAAIDRRSIADDARLTRRLGGNLVRSFWTIESVLAGPPEEYTVAVNSALRPDLHHRSVFMHGLEHRVAQLDTCNLVLDELLLAAQGDSESRFKLDFSLLDALFDGLEDANRDTSDRVALLLVLVSAPPRWIIEAPSDVTLARMGRGYGFASLWDRYVRFHADLYRQLLARYVARGQTDILQAIEIFNEPDYNWTPEEVKIEGAGETLVNPVGKYVTELQLPQVPTTDIASQPFERAPWGFQPQDAAWTQRNRSPVGVLDFDWGPKFDWYVMCAAQLQTHTARAIKDEAGRQGVDVLTVSGSVTHNNVDFLVRMHRGDPAAFENIDRIGLHPYHWINNDVWDDRFVSNHDIAGWPTADPRTFATSYLKRFDFLTALRRSSGDAVVDAELRAIFGDRKLWLTEFGIGSKVLGGFNALAPEHNRFIRPRAFVGASAGYSDVVWEDLWQAFLEDVDESWLRSHDVECMLIYGLRELDRSGYDLDDDDRSNLALFHSDHTPRLDPELIEPISELMQSLTGVEAQDLPALRTATAPAELYRRPWRSVALSDRATEIKTMLSIEERQLLYWLTSNYYAGAGAIIDGGCFLGGSTVPLAEGLRTSGRDGAIDVYDRFEVEPYMNDLYFKDEGRVEGASFRPVFDRNTGHVAELLRVHQGDLMAHPWSGDPIEILFIDFSKTWELNDLIVSKFFPSLIPGKSVLVQQDFVFAICPWVPLTMEYLSDQFEPVAFAEYGSVVYVCIAQVPDDIAPVSSIPHARQLQLMDSAIGRFLGYPRDVLECAKGALLLGHGDLDGVDAILDRLRNEGSDHDAVRAAVHQLTAFR